MEGKRERSHLVSHGTIFPLSRDRANIATYEEAAIPGGFARRPARGRGSSRERGTCEPAVTVAANAGTPMATDRSSPG